MARRSGLARLANTWLPTGFSTARQPQPLEIDEATLAAIMEQLERDDMDAPEHVGAVGWAQQLHSVTVDACRQCATKGWAYFDAIVTASRRDDNPWVHRGDRTAYEPGLRHPERLLGVPVLLKATSQSGVPHWPSTFGSLTSSDRAGFDADRVWPPCQHAAQGCRLRSGLRREAPEEGSARTVATGSSEASAA